MIGGVLGGFLSMLFACRQASMHKTSYENSDKEKHEEDMRHKRTTYNGIIENSLDGPTEREKDFCDCWFNIRKMDRMPTYAEVIGWADKNPRWINTKEDVPSPRGGCSFSRPVVIFILRGDSDYEIELASYEFQTGTWIFSHDRRPPLQTNEVACWLPIPLPTKEQAFNITDEPNI